MGRLGKSDRTTMVSLTSAIDGSSTVVLRRGDLASAPAPEALGNSGDILDVTAGMVYVVVPCQRCYRV